MSELTVCIGADTAGCELRTRSRHGCEEGAKYVSKGRLVLLYTFFALSDVAKKLISAAARWPKQEGADPSGAWKLCGAPTSPVHAGHKCPIHMAPSLGIQVLPFPHSPRPVRSAFGESKFGLGSHKASASIRPHIHSFLLMSDASLAVGTRTAVESLHFGSEEEGSRRGW